MKVPPPQDKAPRRFRLTLRDAGLAVGAASALLAHELFPTVLLWDGTLALMGGLLVGVMLGRQNRTLIGHGDDTTVRVVAQDISTLQQAFRVLQSQVQATIQSSETAVLAMSERMARVYQNASDLQARISHAVQRSQALSADSLSNAGAHSLSVHQVATHQRTFELAREANQNRIQAVAEQVRTLTPLAALISDISRQTSLLSINASIEAARAGPEGAGFKVVAAEVRRLSAQTAEAAAQITHGIAQAAGTIDHELSDAGQVHELQASVQLEEIARHIGQLGDTLSEVVPYLSDLSIKMDAGMAEVTTDIMDTLGDMQFQDINRQLLEQINSALASLSQHFSQLYELIDGQAPPPPELLEELLARWTDNYVMHSQRVAHAQGLEGGRPGAASKGTPAVTTPAATEELTLATSSGPRIELF